MIRFFARAAVAVVSLAALSIPAFAHVTLEVKQAEIGKSYKAVIRVPHGCGTAPTDTVRVHIPEGFNNVKPQPKAGWTLETVTTPTEGGGEHGASAAAVSEIIWSGGNLPNEWYDEFVFIGGFADTLAEGKFYFPTVQQCGDAEEAWIDTSGEEGSDKPAPSLTLVPASGSGH